MGFANKTGLGCGAGTPLKRRMRALVLAVCLLALAGIALFRARQAASSLLGAPLADSGRVASITALTQQTGDDCALLWNGAELPYDAETDAYCLPQPLNGEVRGTLTSSWGRVWLPADEWEGDWTDDMSSGKVRQVYVSDGKRWCSLRVCLSGLPVLSVHTSHSEPAELNYEMRERNYGDVTLFWPEGNFRQQVLSSKVEWHWRGNASLLSQKKSYRLNLLDEAGQSNPLDFLGLGEDDGWILVNFSTDCTRTRDMAANLLWNELAADNESDPAGAVIQYVELYLDDEYMGVYGLCRPLGRKTLDLGANDVLYKWRLSNMMKPHEFDWMEEEQMMDYFGAIEISWPNEWRPGAWHILQPYVKSLYMAEEPVPWETVESLLNVENAVDVALFKQFTCAVDNALQNMYLLYRDDEGLIYRIPWDMNYTFGDCYDAFCDLDLTTFIVPDLELDALYAADPERTQALVAERWQELRQSVFSLDHLRAVYNGLYKTLVQSGAMARDFALWGVNDAYQGWSENDTLAPAETLLFMKERLSYLDKYMQAYQPGDRSAYPNLPQ